MQIIGVFKTHFDYGYTDLAKNVLRDFCTKKLEEALEICEYTKADKNHKYIWTLPAYLLMQMVEHCPSNKRQLLRDFRQLAKSEKQSLMLVLAQLFRQVIYDGEKQKNS